MALSADTIRNRRGTGDMDELAIKTGSTVYVGSLLARTTSSTRVQAASATAATRVVGVAVQFSGDVRTGVGNTAGTAKVVFRRYDEHEFTVATAIRTNTSLGLTVFVSDDDKVAGTAVGTAAKRIPAGELTRWVDATGADKSKGFLKVAVLDKTNIAV